MGAEAILRGLLAVAAAYLIGSIPWGIVVAKLVGGPDPRTVGSGRTGGANVMRALGPGAALLSGVLDLLKGTVAVLLARVVDAGLLVEILAGLASVVGHSRSIFIGFGGGRGVAPAFGSLVVFQPLVAAAIVPIFLAIVVVTRYSSVGSLAAAAIAGLAVGGLVALGQLPPLLLLYAVGGAGLIWLFHLENIRRLLAGEERRIDLGRRERGGRGQTRGASAASATPAEPGATADGSG